MTEKDTVSMATVQMKPDYAASEVYSTASEPPPVSTVKPPVATQVTSGETNDKQIHTMVGFAPKKYMINS